MIGGTPAVWKEFVILATVVGVASLVLVERNARLVRRKWALDELQDDPTRRDAWEAGPPGGIRTPDLLIRSQSL